MVESVVLMHASILPVTIPLQIPGLGNCFVSNVDQLYVQGSMGRLYIYFEM